MAQQLATMRSPAAYAGVTGYAHRHTGEAAAAAYLALGHAYLLDRRFADATESLRQARKAGNALADYEDFLEAQADHDAGNNAAAEALLHVRAAGHGGNGRFRSAIGFDGENQQGLAIGQPLHRPAGRSAALRAVCEPRLAKWRRRTRRYQFSSGG